jgi:hypothetical protein
VCPSLATRAGDSAGSCRSEVQADLQTVNYIL